MFMIVNNKPAQNYKLQIPITTNMLAHRISNNSRPYYVLFLITKK